MTPCKCCGDIAVPIGSVDAARSCEDRRGPPPFAETGQAVPYLACRSCGFLFTNAFDGLDDAELGRVIYNDEYVLADPDFREARPRYMARTLGKLMAPVRNSVRMLDYGGGGGLMARLLQEDGFTVETYDPYFQAAAFRKGAYDVVTAIEVVEHSRDPLGTFRDIASALSTSGAILFTTELRPPGAGLEWPYVAPRNGHVSLHTRASLLACARACNMVAHSVSQHFHLFLPLDQGRIADHLVSATAGEALYAASLAGPRAWLGTAWRVARAGSYGAALNPRHAARALLRRVKRA